MKVLPNGDIIFPHRGSPPPDVPNYVRDPGDPFLFHLAFKEECTKYRVHKLTVLPCGKTRQIFWCKYFETPTSSIVCNECPIEPKCE